MQVELAREAALKGPHSFPVERLLSAFWHLLRSGGEGDDEDPAQGLNSRDTFVQITSLVSLKLLSRVRFLRRSQNFCRQLCDKIGCKAALEARLPPAGLNYNG